MLTLITGTPGAGKSLKAVWDFARQIPGTTIEVDGEAVQRTLYSNVKDLLVDHQHMTAADLDSWHTWAKPGDVILFDEVQEVWRPRGLGTKVPDCIAKLETHRHMGVDLILVTQHPMLVDPNIRRLVNQHIHLRRLAGKVSMVYEWDHCSNPQATSTSIHSGLWWHPRGAYGLYRSAQAHTKPATRIPKIAWVGVAALAFLGYKGYTGQLLPSFLKPATAEEAKAPTTKTTTTVTQGPPPGMVLPDMPKPPEGPLATVAMVEPAKPVLDGCVAIQTRCSCYTAQGKPVEVDPQICEPLQDASRKVPTVGRLRSEITGYSPPPAPAGIHF